MNTTTTTITPIDAIPSFNPSPPLDSSSTASTGNNKSCPCKKLPLCLSSFTAAEYGDLHSLAKKANAFSSLSSSNINLVNQKDKVSGYTPLHLAAQHGHVAVTSYLLQLGCSVDATMLHRTSFSGAVATLKLLLQEDSNNVGRMQLQEILLSKDETFGDFRTPLHKASAGGRYLAVQLLLDTLRENNILKEGISLHDSNQQTPLDVASDLLLRQHEERQSVARWDQVAGGVADWSKCVQLLQNAESEVTRMNENIHEKDDQVGQVMQQKRRQQNPQSQVMAIPSHLTRQSTRYACIDCTDSNGICLTTSWQTAFQAALGNSVEQTLSLATPSSQCIVIPSSKKTILTDTTAPADSGGTANNASKTTEQQTISSSSGGISCSECGKHTIALYPTNNSKGLICKSCKRKSL